MNVPIEKIENETKFLKSYKDITQIANYYNINKDLFDQAYFRPALDFYVKFGEENNVYTGNRIAANKVNSSKATKLIF